MYNRLLTVVYDPGLGGEFLAWVLGQNESYVPTSVYVNSNNNYFKLYSEATTFGFNRPFTGIQAETIRRLYKIC